MVGQLPVTREEFNELKNKIELIETMLGAIKLALESQEVTDNALKAAVQQVEGAATNAQNTANDAVNRANNAQNTANDAVNRANNAQNTANDAVNRANNAQGTANGAVKNVRFFPANAVRDTRNQTNNVQIGFPERVDTVVLESLGNDVNQMRIGSITRVNDNTFNVNFTGIHGNGHRWIPSLRFIGIQVSK